MKKKVLGILLTFVMVVTCMSGMEMGAKAATKLKLTNVASKKVLNVGSQFQMKANISSEKLTYTSSNSGIATISSGGLIYGKKSGTCTLVVKKTGTTEKISVKLVVKTSSMVLVSKKTGTYSGKISVKITAKKGYQVYYSTTGKLVKTNKIKSLKSKTLIISKTTKVSVFPVKNKGTVSNSNQMDYLYTIKVTASATATPKVTATPTITATKSPSVTAAPTTTVANDTTLASYVAPAEISWDSEDENTSETNITETFNLSDSMTLSSSNATFSSNVLKIIKGGTYVITGSLLDGQINVAADATVHLILKNVSVNNNKLPALLMKKQKTIITLVGTNAFTQSGGTALTFATEALEDAYETSYGSATVYSTKAVSINGTGTLKVQGKLYHGIKVKDVLKVEDATLTVTEATNNGIVGTQGVATKNAKINVASNSTGIKSGDDTLGRVQLVGGTIVVSTKEDAIEAAISIIFNPTTSTVTTTMPSGGSLTTGSYKGLKAGKTLLLQGGTNSFSTADDGVHTSGVLIISGGTTTISSGDDGVHSDNALRILGGTIKVTKSYEGIESAQMTMLGGNLSVVASDDGINIAGGTTISVANKLIVTGGIVRVDSTGDGIDVGGGEPNTADDSGSIYIYGGEIYVNGPTESNNAALDYNESTGKCEISGGTLVAVGSTGMAQAPTAGSLVPSVLVSFTSNNPAGTVVSIRDSKGNILCSHTSSKAFQSAAMADQDLVLGGTYYVYLGNTLYQSVTFSSVCMKIGTSGNNPGPPSPW